MPIARSSLLVTLLLVAPVLASSSSAQVGSAAPTGVATAPPVVRAGLRLPEIQLHDPWILADRATRTYYLYSSASPRITGQGRTGTLYYTSKDLATWEGPYIAFVAPKESWADPENRGVRRAVQ